MNKQAVAVIALLGFFILLGSGAFEPMTLGFFEDVGIEQSQAEAYIEENEVRIVEQLRRSRFPHPTDQTVEVYELVAGNESKLKLRIDWENYDITLLDEEDGLESDLKLKMDEKVYHRMCDRLRAVVEGEKGLNDDKLYAAIASGTEVKIKGKSGLQETIYKMNLARWFTSGYENVQG